MALKGRSKFKSYFKKQSIGIGNYLDVVGGKEKKMSKYLKLLRLSGLSEYRYNWAESRFYEDDEFSFSCVEFEVLMRDPCSR